MKGVKLKRMKKNKQGKLGLNKFLSAIFVITISTLIGLGSYYAITLLLFPVFSNIVPDGVGGSIDFFAWSLLLGPFIMASVAFYEFAKGQQLVVKIASLSVIQSMLIIFLVFLGPGGILTDITTCRECYGTTNICKKVIDNECIEGEIAITGQILLSPIAIISLLTLLVSEARHKRLGN